MEAEGGCIDWIARILTWLEPYLAWGLGVLESGSPTGMLLTIPAGIALGLSPATYPLVPVVVGYAAGGKKSSAGRRASLSFAFAAGIVTVYAMLGVLFGIFGLALLTLLNRSVWLWYGLLAPILWIMGLRLAGVFRFGIPLLDPPDPERAEGRGFAGAYLLGLPAGLAGCPSCAFILPAVLTAAALGGNPFTGALALVGLGIGQGAVLVFAGTYVGALTRLRRLAPYRFLVERALGVLLLAAAAYFTWRALIWL